MRDLHDLHRPRQRPVFPWKSLGVVLLLLVVCWFAVVAVFVGTYKIIEWLV